MNETSVFQGKSIRLGAAGIILVLILTSCTTSRWVARKTPGIDMTDGQLLHRKKIVVLADSLSPQNPVLRFKIMNIDTIKYPQRLIVDRYIQSYKPRYGFMAAGLLASGFLFYTANSSILHGSKSVRYALDGGGVLLAAAAFLNQKPVGKAVPTNESRLTKKIGSVVKVDTVENKKINDTTLTINAYYHKRKPINDLRSKVTAGEFRVNLANTMRIDSITAVNPGSLDVRVGFNGEQFGFKVPIKKFMERYAVVIRPTAALHSMPLDNDINTLADISYDTQLKYVDSPDSSWYKVLYGIAPSYLKKGDAILVWKLSAGNNIIQMNASEPYTGFGSVDIEQGIPDTIRKYKFNRAVIINDAFDTSGTAVQKTIYGRDTHLVSQYVQKALGYPSNQIKVFDAAGIDSLSSWIGMREHASALDTISYPDSTRLLVYFVGSDNNDTAHRKLLAMISAVSKIRTASTALLLDIHFGKEPKTDIAEVDTAFGGLDYHRSIEHQIRAAVSVNPNLLAILSSSPGQNAGIYKSVPGHIDKMHGIFTYYFCKALKSGNYRWAAIDRYLERNVTFTSRSLLNTPQDPEVFGNNQNKLINNQ